MSQLFLDLDGVLADFDGQYARHFGFLPDKNSGGRSQKDPPGMWENIRNHGRFFLEMDPLKDAYELWEGVKHLNPTVLTGVPFHQVPNAEEQKRAWLAKHFGADVRVICCRSKDKRLHGKPGDVLVDDWVKYQHLWVEMGGIFVLHTSAQDSLAQLKGLKIKWAT